LLAAGHGLGDVARLLAEQSGFSAWLGRPCTLAEIARRPGGDPALDEAREFLGYQIRKAVGAFVSALGGVDAIAFVTEDLTAYTDFIRSLSVDFAFLPFASAPDTPASGRVLRLAREHSRVQVYGLQYDKWQALSERGNRALGRACG
jgi:acetate kinase